MGVQRSNVACITATVDSHKLLNELFELFHTNGRLDWAVNASFSLSMNWTFSVYDLQHFENKINPNINFEK